jgi:hypothetical protein
MSEDIYNVTFMMTNSERTPEHYKLFTPSILTTREIVEAYGGKFKLDFVITRDPETSEWVFDFGKGVSEKTLEIRERQWRGNHYLSQSKYPTADDCYK